MSLLLQPRLQKPKLLGLEMVVLEQLLELLQLVRVLLQLVVRELLQLVVLELLKLVVLDLFLLRE